MLEPTLAKLIAVLLDILLACGAVLVFAIVVGIKVECPNCGMGYFHHHSICPECGHKYGDPIDDSADEEEDIAPDADKEE